MAHVRYGNRGPFRDDRGRFRKQRYEEFDALQKFAHDYLRPATERLAKQMAEQHAADTEWFCGPGWTLTR